MEQDKRKVITEYLKGPRDYNEGVALYQRFGVNLMLKRRFVVDDTATTAKYCLMNFAKSPDLPKRSLPHFRAGQKRSKP